MSDEHSRYEINRRVRQVLVSHNTDMTKVSYSFINKTLHIYGSLFKDPRGEFNISSIKTLVADLMILPRINNVQFDLDNWVISTESGDLSIVKGKGLGPRPLAKHGQEA